MICRTGYYILSVTTYLHSFFASELGDDIYVDDTMDAKKRTVEMFHSRIDELNRDNILASMGKPDGSVQICSRMFNN